LARTSKPTFSQLKNKGRTTYSTENHIHVVPVSGTPVNSALRPSFPSVPSPFRRKIKNKVLKTPKNRYISQHQWLPSVAHPVGDPLLTRCRASIFAFNALPNARPTPPMLFVAPQCWFTFRSRLFTFVHDKKISPKNPRHPRNSWSTSNSLSRPKLPRIQRIPRSNPARFRAFDSFVSFCKTSVLSPFAPSPADPPCSHWFTLVHTGSQ
jgi:hypothetical protein